jgi:hypothetical protein
MAYFKKYISHFIPARLWEKIYALNPQKTPSPAREIHMKNQHHYNSGRARIVRKVFENHSIYYTYRVNWANMEPRVIGILAIKTYGPIEVVNKFYYSEKFKILALWLYVLYILIV